MKVLMFGWEFPPKIYGGLAVASYGITKGMVEGQPDAEITFCLPKPCGDEEKFLRIIGMNQVPIVYRDHNYDYVKSRVPSYMTPEEYYNFRDHIYADFSYMNVNDMGNRIQLCGVNVAERLRAGLINFDESRKGLSSWLDIGLFNVGASTYLQIGVLNYNYNAPIPWMVLFNCSFGERRKATPQREDGDDEPDRVFVAPASREKQATDR